VPCRPPPSPETESPLPYMLNTRSEEESTVFYSYVACCMNTLPMNMYEFLSYTGFTRWNALFIFLWLRHWNM